MRFGFSFAVSIVIALAVLSCASSSNDWIEQTPEPDVTTPSFLFAGTVQYVDVEGGVFVIRGADGTQYNPINLPESFKVHDMNVEVEVRRRDDLVSIAMVGPLVEVLRIRARPD